MLPSDSEVQAARQVPGHPELFSGFLTVALSGFGGVLPFARREFVERRRWLDEREFAEALALCQFLPGPNIVNMAVIVGSRFRGVTGATVGVAGLVILPLFIMMACGALYARYGDLEILRGPLAGLAAARGTLAATAAGALGSAGGVRLSGGTWSHDVLSVPHGMCRGRSWWSRDTVAARSGPRPSPPNTPS